MPRSTNVRQRKPGRPPKIVDDETESKDEGVHGDQGWWTFCKVVVFSIFGLPALLVLVLVLFVKSPIDPVVIDLPSPPVWTGPLETNTILQAAERLYENRVIGPESIVFDHGHLYTGTADGKVLHIDRGQIQELAKFGTPPCKGDFASEPRCGRPLGMRLNKDGYLIVLDAYLGMFKVNVATGDFERLLSPDVEIGGAKLRFLNDLDIATDGTIYFTDSSAKWQRREFLMSIMEGRGDGRLMKFNVETNTTELLLDGLYFANGVQLSRKEDYLLVAETTTARIMKYHLKGAKKGKAEVFADNLPGVPDNIRRSRSGGYWVTIATCRKGESFSLMDFLAPRPELRKHLAKLPIPWVLPLFPRCAMVIQMNEEGQIVRSLQDLKGSVLQSISQVEDDAGVLYLGSYHAPYLGKIDISRKT